MLKVLHSVRVLGGLMGGSAVTSMDDFWDFWVFDYVDLVLSLRFARSRSVCRYKHGMLDT
jgi:hypothetical protein